MRNRVYTILGRLTGAGRPYAARGRSETPEVNVAQFRLGMGRRVNLLCSPLESIDGFAGDFGLVEQHLQRVLQ